MRNIRLQLPHESFDLVLMNPPLTRNTGQEAAKLGVPNPMFAAFGTPKEEQRAMARAMAKLLNPNPPKDTDGRREESGRGVRELQGK